MVLVRDPKPEQLLIANRDGLKPKASEQTPILTTVTMRSLITVGSPALKYEGPKLDKAQPHWAEDWSP